MTAMTAGDAVILLISAVVTFLLIDYYFWKKELQQKKNDTQKDVEILYNFIAESDNTNVRDALDRILARLIR